MQTTAFKTGASFTAARKAGAVRTSAVRRAPMVVRATAAPEVDDMGFKLMRKGVKVAASETILTPRYVSPL